MNEDLKKLFEQFMSESRFSDKRREATLRGYQQTFTTFTKLMPEVSLDLLSPATMTTFFQKMDERERLVGKGEKRKGVKRSTVATYRSKLNSFFNWLKKRNHLKENPFETMDYPKVEYNNRKYLSKQDVEKILTAIMLNSGSNHLIRKRNVAMLMVFVYAGLRRGELLQLQVRDINFERREMTIRGETSKSDKTRTMPLHRQAITALEDYLYERDKQKDYYTTQYLFVSDTRDDRLSHDGLKHWVKRLRELSSIRFHAHQFRHTFAANLLNGGVDIFKIKELLGHTDIRMTMSYLRSLPTSVMKGDVEALNIDNFL